MYRCIILYNDKMDSHTSKSFTTTNKTWTQEFNNIYNNINTSKIRGESYIESGNYIFRLIYKSSSVLIFEKTAPEGSGALVHHGIIHLNSSSSTYIFFYSNGTKTDISSNAAGSGTIFTLYY